MSVDRNIYQIMQTVLQSYGKLFADQQTARGSRDGFTVKWVWIWVKPLFLIFGLLEIMVLIQSLVTVFKLCPL
jgi:hypothetical protein